MLPQILISVSARCNVEVALDFVSIQTAIYPARIRLASNPGRLAEPPRLRLAELLMHIPQLFPARIDAVVLAQLMHTLLHLPACPLRPVCGVVAEHIAGQGSVAGSVLHVDTQVGAAHGDYDVEIDLHVV